jgi:hypothetical protein
MAIIGSKQNVIKLSVIHSDPKLGTWWAFGTDKQWIELRTTKTGLIREGNVKKGKHPYFTVTPKDNHEAR